MVFLIKVEACYCLNIIEEFHIYFVVFCCFFFFN